MFPSRLSQFLFGGENRPESTVMAILVVSTGEDVVPPARIAALMDKPERCTTINPSLAELKQLIEGDVDGL